jgi:pectate lyase
VVGPEAFGGALGAIPDFLLGDYEAGMGPGLTLWSNGAIAVYLDGSLAASSASRGESHFVPLSFLPGQRTIAVLVAAEEQTPALGVRVEELSGPIQGDELLVQSDATGDWALPGFDDGAWDRVSPDPTAQACAVMLASEDLPPIHRIPTGSGSAVFRFHFAIGPTGFGENTTGGSLAPELADTGDHLQALLESAEPRVVVLREGVLELTRPAEDSTPREMCPGVCPDESDKTIYPTLLTDEVCPVPTVTRFHDERTIAIRSNKTLVGLGRGTQLRGTTLEISDGSNVILRNLAMTHTNPELIEAGDGVSIRTSSDVWIDHCTFKWISDGFTDISSSTRVTLSWVRNEGVNTAACANKHPRSNEIESSDVTFHHVFWNHVFGRAPQVNAMSRVHVFNSLVSDDPSFAVGARCGGEVLVEGSSFELVATPTEKLPCPEEAPDGLIDATLDNFIDGDSGEHVDMGDEAPTPNDAVFTPPYEYILDGASAARTVVRERAGVGGVWAQPLTE